MGELRDSPGNLDPVAMLHPGVVATATRIAAEAVRMVVVEKQRLIAVRKVIVRICRATLHRRDCCPRFCKRQQTIGGKFVRQQLRRRRERPIPCA